MAVGSVPGEALLGWRTLAHVSTAAVASSNGRSEFLILEPFIESVNDFSTFSKLFKFVFRRAYQGRNSCFSIPRNLLSVLNFHLRFLNYFLKRWTLLWIDFVHRQCLLDTVRILLLRILSLVFWRRISEFPAFVLEFEVTVACYMIRVGCAISLPESSNRNSDNAVHNVTSCDRRIQQWRALKMNQDW